ncbi:MAG: hypothetical protein F4039_07055 [Gammaproteobacteria bacterium]|nr:hypothetical protein [Gammaproteobacteria bacterium]MYK43827.1 hypothetical protein [Gammaproteobacteria bacterium]
MSKSANICEQRREGKLAHLSDLLISILTDLARFCSSDPLDYTVPVPNLMLEFETKAQRGLANGKWI